MHSKGPEKPNEARVMLSGSPASNEKRAVDGRKRNAFRAGGSPCRKKSGRSDRDSASGFQLQELKGAGEAHHRAPKEMHEGIHGPTSIVLAPQGRKAASIISRNRFTAELDQAAGRKHHYQASPSGARKSRNRAREEAVEGIKLSGKESFICHGARSVPALFFHEGKSQEEPSGRPSLS